MSPTQHNREISPIPLPLSLSQTKSIMDTLPRLLRLKLACAINKRLFAKVALSPPPVSSAACRGG